MKTNVHTNICMQMYITGLFIMAQNETIQIFTNKWIDKQNTIEYYLAIKLNEIMIYAIT